MTKGVACNTGTGKQLDARAEDAVRELEDGAVSVAVIDDTHRVDRIMLSSAAGVPAENA